MTFVDIVMIGHSKAGKTSYIAAMYEAMTDGPAGFAVRAMRPEDHQALIRRARHLREGTYPVGTDRRNAYELRLTHDGADVFDFVWRDYRGEALMESSTSAQAQQLRRDISTAGGLVLMFDSTELDDVSRATARARPLISTILHSLKERNGILPLVIVLTKWDLVNAAEVQTLEVAGHVLGGLIHAVRATSHIYGALVPIACGTNSLNVVQPVLWCLHVGIAKRGLILQQSIDHHAGLVREALDGDTWWDRTVSAIAGRPSRRDIAAYYFQGAYVNSVQMEPLIRPSQMLGDVLQPVLRF